MQNELISELCGPVRDTIFQLQWLRKGGGGGGSPGTGAPPPPPPLKFFRAVYKTFSAILETLQD